eukprot:15450939-Alexandrium_andersonii.AAC.1
MALAFRRFQPVAERARKRRTLHMIAQYARALVLCSSRQDHPVAIRLPPRSTVVPAGRAAGSG